MTKNPFQHIDLRVTDMAVADAFYGRLLPALGFGERSAGKHFHTYAAEGEPPWQPWFGFTEDKGHRPNVNRIAFAAESREHVDRLAAVALEAGARKMSGPRECPEYSPTYYAAFFDDPFGNALEICYVAD